MLPEPFYQDELTTIYHGDCEEIAPKLGRFDLLLTDPPYGIGESGKKAASRGSKKVAPGNYGDFDWDKSPPPRQLLDDLRSLSDLQIIWGGNYFHLPPTSCILVWDKDNGSTDFADCELAWTNLKKAVRKFTYRWFGYNQEPGRPKEKRVHPTQKPLALMHWCLNFAPDAKTVFDPYMGSGTTLLAAKQKGIKAVGIEREIEYCQLAVDRLSQTTLNLFA